MFDDYKFYKEDGVAMAETPEGYFDIESLLSDDYPFLFVVGGRGRGKTYSTLKYLRDKRHVFIRRTKDEIENTVELDNTGDFEASESPWRQLNKDLDGDGHCIKAFKLSGGRYAFYDIGNLENWCLKGNDIEQNRTLLANIIALSDVGKVKGGGYENVPYIVFDEFIAMQGVRNTKYDGMNLIQVCETISRNREMNGLSATKVICLANATTIANPVFLDFGLINVVAYMVNNHYSRVDMPERGIRVLLLPASGKFTEKKKRSALYKAIGTDSMAYKSNVENTFVSDDFADVIEKYQLQGAKHYCYFQSRSGKFYTLYTIKDKWRLSEGCVGKGKRDLYTYNLNSTKDIYLAEKAIFADTWFDYCEGLLSFDSYETKVLYFNIVNKKLTPR